MKRVSKPFVVEHKRRSRAGSDDAPSIWTGVMGRELQRELARAEEGLAQANGEAVTTVVFRATAQSVPTVRRILEEVVAPAMPNDAPTQDTTIAATLKSQGEKQSRPDPAHLSAKRGLEADPCPAVSVEPAPSSDLVTSAEAEPADAAAARTSYRQRRRAATGELPVGERWKSGLRGRATTL